MLYSICIVLILVASIILILAILVQNPKSGMAANFGAANQVMGVRDSREDYLDIGWFDRCFELDRYNLYGERCYYIRWRFAEGC